jgi:alpha-galactosidase/6-phospho-beta-glucosidase family protein
MKKKKIVLIGGGSYNWTPTLARDLFVREGLSGSELVLVDIDPAALALLERYCTELAVKCGTGWSVRAAELADRLLEAHRQYLPQFDKK